MQRKGEVDFVVRTGRTLTAIEVKSGRAPEFLARPVELWTKA